MWCAEVPSPQTEKELLGEGGGGGGGGGSGYSTKFFTDRLRPEVQTLTRLYTAFDKKGNPYI